MYVPAHFAVHSDETVDRFLARYPFATLVSPGADPEASHIPLLARREGGILILYGHLARANPMCAAVVRGDRLLAVFHGPHAYISPLGYRRVPAVPTWNYAVVHVKGRARTVEDAGAALASLRELVARFEGAGGLPGEVMPEAFAEGLAKGVLAFEMAADAVEAKFKLGQNRAEEDRWSTWERLKASKRAEDRALAEFMVDFGGLPDGAGR